MADPLEYEATYPHPPEAVWRALTTREALATWLMENTFEEAVVGHRFRFMDKPKPVLGWDGVTECEVLDVEPERRLVIRFNDGTGGFPVTRLVFELEPVDAGTHVRFRHEGFTGFKGWLMRAGMKHGWGTIMDHALPIVLDRMAKGEALDRDGVRREAKDRVRAAVAARRAQS